MILTSPKGIIDMKVVNIKISIVNDENGDDWFWCVLKFVAPDNWPETIGEERGSGTWCNSGRCGREPDYADAASEAKEAYDQLKEEFNL